MLFMDNGTFVTVEGIDGAGKSTVVNAIEEHFESTLFWQEDDYNTVDVIRSKEPSNYWTGDAVYRAIDDDSQTPPLTDFLLYIADRANHVENTVLPALDAGQLVVSDRYVDSTRAYQPVALQGQLDDPEQFIETVHEQAGDWCLQPDLTIYIDISVDTALERTEGGDKYEKRDFLEQVRENYEQLAETHSDRFVRIDGEQSKEEVGSEAITEVSKYALQLLED